MSERDMRLEPIAGAESDAEAHSSGRRPSVRNDTTGIPGPSQGPAWPYPHPRGSGQYCGLTCPKRGLCHCSPSCREQALHARSARRWRLYARGHSFEFGDISDETELERARQERRLPVEPLHRALRDALAGGESIKEMSYRYGARYGKSPVSLERAVGRLSNRKYVTLRFADELLSFLGFHLDDVYALAWTPSGDEGGEMR